MIRVGFVLETDGWMGGINYYRNLFSALKLLSSPTIQPVIFVGTHVSDDVLGNFRDAEIVRSPLLDTHTLSGTLRRLLNKVTSRQDILLKQLLVRHDIKVLSHLGRFFNVGSIKTIGWITDFQHLHLPQFFSEKERKQRDTDFRAIAQYCDCVLLSSESAKNDLANFALAALPRAKVLQFVPEIDSMLEFTSIQELESKYGVTRPFFYVPNQFWIHKNHSVVIDALAHLQAQGIQATVLSTGSTKDYRHPDHFEKLMTRISELGLHNSFKALGLVPYKDLLSLMHYSLAIINPSFFEGWSSTVEEAKALGKTILLSNLPVHKEQNPAGGIFFDPKNSQELAEKMHLILTSIGNVSDIDDLNLKIADSYIAARLSFGEKYQHIVESSMGK
ncbi:glycosyltransferase family 4 protein [Oxalicibacterium solurbis]|uniref:Glycosyl transferase n=1 Tax=Oxalicibacterium solurbis TaxID=69280 RepID=A0A8J3F4E0_9BURK|nr:glycosyltransferase family 1 protein [Oxalicibacterium solurbis]GGI54437.1 glycosyl transferase [Oxalicibacterium solurbis]